MSFLPFYILPQAGLQKNKKPFLILESAFQRLNNAFLYRESVRKRLGIKLVGRLRRVLTSQSLGTTVAAQTDYNFLSIFTTISISGELNAEIVPGSLVITIGAPDAATFTDQGDGTFAVTGKGVAAGSFVNYADGEVNLILSAPVVGGATITADINYFPALPVMGIHIRELATINVEQTVFFDTKYAYIYDGNDFQELSSTVATTWNGTDADFFWAENFRGITANVRLFFVTNFTNPNSPTYDPPRYYNGITWADFTPDVSSTERMYQAKLFISYYGRLLALNTWEGTIAGAGAGSVNFYNRCRFSQIGNPLETNAALPVIDLAWRSDIFGRGGFIDAPTNEAIVTARFYKNTLIVFFERSTWQLRYVGEYGLPFLWERISSDFGSESTFSSVLFDKGVLAVGDKAIVGSSGNNVERIDLDIPDTVFSFLNINEGKERVHGIRDFQKELVFWSYSDGTGSEKWPNNVLVYNYRNNTWANLRDNTTAFGTLTTADGDSWDSPISWDSYTSWDTFYKGEFPAIVSGNQQGYIHYYQSILDPDTVQDNLVELMEHESLSIIGITRSNTERLEINVPNHNLENDEIVYVAGLQFLNTTDSTIIETSLNNRFYLVTIINDDNIGLMQWDPAQNIYINTSFNDIGFTPAPGTGTYIGGGVLALIPKLDIITKDFNPFADKGFQFKSSYVDFQTDATPNAEVSIFIYENGSIGDEPSDSSNFPIYNPNMVTALGQTGMITNITKANPAVITSTNHGLMTGRKITIGTVNGMTEVNSNIYTVTFIDLNRFSLNGVDSSAFTTYTYGGQWWTVDQNFYYDLGSRYAWHRFYSNVHAQYLTYQITYSDSLMNSPITHVSDFQMNAMILYARQAGRLIP